MRAVAAPSPLVTRQITGTTARWWRTVTAVTVAALLAACGGGTLEAGEVTADPEPGKTQESPAPAETQEPVAETFTAINTVTLESPQLVLSELSQVTGVTVLGPNEYVLINGRTGQLQWVRGQTPPQEVTGPAVDHLVQSIAQAKVDIEDHEFSKLEGGNHEALVLRPMPQILDVVTSPTFSEDHLLYVFVSTGESSQVITAKWRDGTLELGTEVLAGLPAGAGRNGGALGFGPDGYLFVSVGDTGQPSLAQDPTSLAGKILRVTPDGEIPGNNPLTGSPVWSLGHRNVTAMAWTQTGQMYAVEQGQVVADELNLITPGANYGWPLVEGRGNTDLPENQVPEAQMPTPDPSDTPPNEEADSAWARPTRARVDQLTVDQAVARGFTAPALQWDWSAGRTTAADPVSLVATSEGLYIAGFHGERLWRVGLLEVGLGGANELIARDFGPLGQVALTADNELLVLATNTSPNPGTGSITLPTIKSDEVTARQDDSLLLFKVTY